MSQPLIALLGRKDEPTDAVEEYCRYLGAALEAHDFQLQIRRVPWKIHGWRDSLDALGLQATGWRGTWVLVQYTALAWSSRGFPQRFLRVLRVLKSAGARIGIVYHDVESFYGARFVDRLRRSAQIRTMRRALHLADLAIFTVLPEKLSWLSSVPRHAAFIPVGPNLPISAHGIVDRGFSRDNAADNFSGVSAPDSASLPTIGVFSITSGEAGVRETKIILSTVRHAAQQLGAIRLSVFGRAAELREPELRQGLQDMPVNLSVEGVVEPDQVVQKLCACDVLLFVRGEVSSRRSSAIAGIACGLPVIAFSGSETAHPITDAGVLLVPKDKSDQIEAGLVRVLSDSAYHADLAARSRAAYQLHFSWPVIAARFSALLKTC